MIDMHSHILPGIDDGSYGIEESISMIKEAYEAGFSDIVSTSHYIEESYNANKNEREDLIKILSDRLKEEHIDVNIYNGAEVYVATNMPELIKEERLPTINNSKYLLMELPMNSEILYLENIIYDLQANDIIPIIAHPERYSYVQKNPKMLYKLIEQGVLFQSNYASIIGKYGREAEKTVKKLFKMDVIHFLGSDAHRSRSIYREMELITKKLVKVIGKDKFRLLSEENPRKVLKNEDI